MIQFSHKYLAGSGLGPLLIKTVIGSAGLRIAGMFFGFLVGVQLARGLGVEGYGVYGLAMAIIALLTVPTEFGLPQLLTREVAAAQVAKDWGRLRGILKWSSKIVLLISVVITVAVVIWLAAIERDFSSALSMTLIAGLLMVPLVALGNLLSATLRGLQYIVKGQFPDALVRPASFSLLLFLIPLVSVPLNSVLAMGLGALSAACAFGVALAMLWKHLPSETYTTIPRIQSHDWWSSALPMALTEGMRVLQGHLVILLLGFMVTVARVGLFRVAGSMLLLINFPVSLFNVVGAPIIARLYAQGDRARLQRLLSWVALGMVSSTLLLTLPFFFAGVPLLSTVFGEEFGDANTPLLILCGGALLNAFFGANAALLNMTGHQVWVTRASVVSLVLLVVTTLPLIILFDVVGAAIANALAMLAWNILMWLDARRLLILDTSLLHLFKSSAIHV